MSQLARVTHGSSGNARDGIKAPFFDGTQPCREIGPDLFFAEDNSEAEKLKALVKPICGKCQFNSECLEWALVNNELGIWAGTTDLDRQRLKRKNRS
jgi:hypothetical protein